MRPENSLRWTVLRALRPYLRNGLVDRGKWLLLHKLNPRPGQDLDCLELGCRVCRVKGGGYILCDLRHAADRFVYLCGEYEIGLTRFIRSVLSPHWRFVDVGANVGKYMVLAAPRTHEVLCIEPNPVSRWFLQTNIALNSFTNVKVAPIGLDEQSGQATLSYSGDNIGGASLIDDANSTNQFTVPVLRGDELAKFDGPTYLKVDVEGFEERVLRGFEGLLDAKETVIQAEITDEWLRRVGGSAGSLFTYMADKGYFPFAVRTRSQLRTTFELVALESPLEKYQYDVVFLPNCDLPSFWKWVGEIRRK